MYILGLLYDRNSLHACTVGLGDIRFSIRMLRTLLMHPHSISVPYPVVVMCMISLSGSMGRVFRDT